MERGYNVMQVSQLLGIKSRTVREWIHTGKIKANKIYGSQRWIVMESEVKRLQGVHNSENNN